MLSLILISYPDLGSSVIPTRVSLYAMFSENIVSPREALTKSISDSTSDASSISLVKTVILVLNVRINVYIGKSETAPMKMVVTMVSSKIPQK